MLKLLTAEQKQLRVQVSQDMLDSTNSDPYFINTIILKRPLKGKRFQTSEDIRRNNENPTRALNITSLKCSLPSTDAIDRREKFTLAYEGSTSPLFKSIRFSQKKKFGYFPNRLLL